MSTRVALGIVVALVTASCASGGSGISTLPPVPTSAATTTATAAPAIEPVADTGTCQFVVGGGALVLRTRAGFDVATVLQPGDLITDIDDVHIGSSQALQHSLLDRLPGDVVELSYIRDDVSGTEPVELGQRPDDPRVGMLGVDIDSQLDGFTPEELEVVAAAAPPSSHLAIANEELYRLEPIGATWHPTGIPNPGVTVYDIGGSIYQFDGATGRMLSLDDSRSFDIAAGGWVVLQPLAVSGTLMVAEVGAASPDDPTVVGDRAVIATDLAAGEVRWEWDFDSIDDQLAPFAAFPSPDGESIVVSMQQDGTFVHVLLNGSGEPVAGFGTRTDFVPAATLVGGWFNDTSVVWTAPLSEDEVFITASDVDTLGTVFVATLPDLETLRQVLAVGDGRHLVVVSDDETVLLDTLISNVTRPLARNCATTIVQPPSG